MKEVTIYPCGCRSWTRQRGAEREFVLDSSPNCKPTCDVQEYVAGETRRQGKAVRLEARP